MQTVPVNVCEPAEDMLTSSCGIVGDRKKHDGGSRGTKGKVSCFKFKRLFKHSNQVEDKVEDCDDYERAIIFVDDHLDVAKHRCS